MSRTGGRGRPHRQDLAEAVRRTVELNRGADSRTADKVEYAS